MTFLHERKAVVSNDYKDKGFCDRRSRERFPVHVVEKFGVGKR